MGYNYINKVPLLFRFDDFCINKTDFSHYVVKSDKISFIIAKVVKSKK